MSRYCVYVQGLIILSSIYQKQNADVQVTEAELAFTQQHQMITVIHRIPAGADKSKAPSKPDTGLLVGITPLNPRFATSSTGWLHCYANLADMYKTQKRFEEASSLLARMPWLPSPQGITTTDSESASQTPSDESPTAGDSGVDDGSDILAVPLGTGQAVAAGADIPEDGSSSGAEATADGESAGVSLHPSDKNQEEQQSSGDVGGAEDPSTPGSPTPSKGGGGGRSDAPPPRGAGAARVAGLNKAAAAAAAAAAAESAAAAAGAVETGAEAAARAVVERHAEAMRASMNELVGELAVTTATRPSASQDWLNSRVVAAEEVG